MDLCDQCGNKSLMPEHYSDVCLCKKCSMKLLSSTWKNKEYDSNEEIDRQMEKVIKLAGKYSYSPKVIEGLSSFFSSKKIDGLYRKFSGGCGQKIIVCSDRLIIKTEADFDIKEIRKAYKRMCAGKRGAIGIGDYVSAQQATQIVSMAIGNIVPGRGFIKSGIKALGSGVASNAISGNVSYNEKPQKSETYEENGISYKKEKYFIFTKMTVLSAVVAFIFAYSLQKSVSDSSMAGFILLGVVAYVALIMSGYTGKWESELKNPYIFLIPDSPLKKMWYATLMEHVKAFADGCIICIPIGIFWHVPVIEIIYCILIYTVLQADRLYTMVIVQSLLGEVFGKTGQSLLRMFIQMALLGVGAGVGVLAAVLISQTLIFPIVLIYGLMITVAMGAIALLRFDTMEQFV